MHLLVLGATGRTGRHVLRDAAAAGHAVTVLVRDPARLDDDHGATVVVGDATSADDLRAALDGVDAVVDATGPVKGGPSDVRARIADALVSAATGRQGLRVVGLTGAGVRRDDDRPGLLDRAVVGVMRLVAADQLEDGTRYVQRLLGAPGLDVTVVRGPRLVDGRSGRAVRLTAGTGGDAGVVVDRADLAAELLRLAATPGTQHPRTPVASSPKGA